MDRKSTGLINTEFVIHYEYEESQETWFSLCFGEHYILINHWSKNWKEKSLSNEVGWQIHICMISIQCNECCHGDEYVVLLEARKWKDQSCALSDQVHWTLLICYFRLSYSPIRIIAIISSPFFLIPSSNFHSAT